MAGVEGFTGLPPTQEFSFSYRRRDIASLLFLLVLAKASFSRTALRFAEPRGVLLLAKPGFKPGSRQRKIPRSEDLGIFPWLGVWFVVQPLLEEDEQDLQQSIEDIRMLLADEDLKYLRAQKL